MKNFDIELFDNANTVKFINHTSEWTIAKEDLNNHSAAWLVNMLFLRPEKETL